MSIPAGKGHMEGMGTIKDVEETEAFQTSRDLVKMVYEFTRKREFAKDFALVDQVRRAAISLLSNISEGFNRGGSKEFIQFLSIAKGSAAEVQAQLIIAYDQRYISEAEYQAARTLSTSAMNQIGGWMMYLQRSEYTGRKFKTGI